ncbi:MAG: GNAT family N-acetyltransferase [Betaproteobacteria bacterium]|nr:GNAT family N-acetyltransferase [Betaproteobacteria bacterium]
MTGPGLIERTPWDCAALGCDAFELADAGAEAMAQVGAPGHYTVRVDPLASKESLHRNGFYYCDTLIEPYCPAGQLKLTPHAAAAFDLPPPLEPLLAICREAFQHDRFHRDFNVDRRLADLRYANWLKTLHAAGKVYGLVWEGGAAGFIAHEAGKLVLHALGAKHRGRGIAKHLWSAVCADLARGGARELSSSISVANVPALNLYATLGFRFRKPLDVYHRVIP